MYILCVFVSCFACAHTCARLSVLLEVSESDGEGPGGRKEVKREEGRARVA